MSEQTARSCDFCKHFDYYTMTCSAFPDGVPMQFLYGIEAHDSPTQGTIGAVFEEDDNPERIFAYLERIEQEFGDQQ